MLVYAIRYYFRIARGYLWRPWASPVLRWRYETLSGLPADELTPGTFLRLSWRYRAQFREFLRWARSMEAEGGTGSKKEWRQWPI